MTIEILLVFGLLALAVVLFTTEIVLPEIVRCGTAGPDLGSMPFSSTPSYRIRNTPLG